MVQKVKPASFFQKQLFPCRCGSKAKIKKKRGGGYTIDCPNDECSAKAYSKVPENAVMLWNDMVGTVFDYEKSKDN